jgi:spermidine/putrescine transport system ATP-binding protein
MAELAHHYPHEISGGQKQRVALARGLVNRPRLLLLDEPLGALDLKLREEMQLELIKLQREVGITFIFVTHSQPEALALSHRIAVMKDGRVEQLDEPSRIYGYPRNRFVADFIGNCNLLEAQIEAAEGNGLRLMVAELGHIQAPADGVSSPGERGVLALRPEQVQVAATVAPNWDNSFPGVVQDFLYIGDVTTYQVRLDNGVTLQALLPNATPGRAKFFEIGDRVLVGWSGNAGHYVRD